MKKSILQSSILKVLTITLVSSLLSSVSWAGENLLKQCYIVDDSGITMSVRLFYGTTAWSGFSSLNSVTLQSGKLNQNGIFAPTSNEFRYEMKLISNFHKGGVYNVNIKWPTGNPGVLMYDAGGESIQVAFYRTEAFGSVSGSGRCNR